MVTYAYYTKVLIKHVTWNTFWGKCAPCRQIPTTSLRFMLLNPFPFRRSAPPLSATALLPSFALSALRSLSLRSSAFPFLAISLFVLASLRSLPCLLSPLQGASSGGWPGRCVGKWKIYLQMLAGGMVKCLSLQSFEFFIFAGYWACESRIPWWVSSILDVYRRRAPFFPHAGSRCLPLRCAAESRRLPPITW